MDIASSLRGAEIVASWVEAVGVVGTVLAAVAISRADVRRHRGEEHAKREAIRESLAATLAFASSVIASASVSIHDSPIGEARLYAEAAFQRLEGIEQAFLRLPVHELGDLEATAAHGHALSLTSYARGIALMVWKWPEKRSGAFGAFRLRQADHLTEVSERIALLRKDVRGTHGPRSVG